MRENYSTWQLGISLLLFMSAAVGLSACGGAEGSSSDNGSTILGTDNVDGKRLAFPEDGARDPNEIRLALKYVNYLGSEGSPILSRAQTEAVVSEMNSIYTSCGIRFILEEYLEINPRDRGLSLGLSSMGELNSVRAQFQDESRFLIVNTGKWNHAGIGSANAWTAMPGEDLMGVVVDKDVASFSQIIAHELGHYLNLDHENDQSNMMNPVIYDVSTGIYKSQCESMRQTATSFWAQVKR